VIIPGVLDQKGQREREAHLTASSLLLTRAKMGPPEPILPQAFEDCSSVRFPLSPSPRSKKPTRSGGVHASIHTFRPHSPKWHQIRSPGLERLLPVAQEHSKCVAAMGKLLFGGVRRTGSACGLWASI
ncbi:hypothetical protein H1C71_028523, partial [Ictidomys tridecemlineatus]